MQSDKDLDQLLNEHFAGRVVRKDLTKQIKEGANVPVYVLEYLLGMYCASDDPEVIETGLRNVKTVLSENYVRPDEAEKVKSLVRERGSYKVIDRVTGKVWMGEVPPYSVVVPGTQAGRPNVDGEPGPGLYCAVIVKTVDERTRSKTSINELLRA